MASTSATPRTSASPPSDQLLVYGLYLTYGVHARQSQKSSTFQFNGGNWRLRYNYRKCHTLGLEKISGKRLHPFYAEVSVLHPQDSRQCRLEGLSATRNFKNEFQGPTHTLYRIWSKHDREIKLADWEFSQSQILTFNVNLRHGSALEGDKIDTTNIGLPVSPSACLEGLSQDLSKMLDQDMEPEVVFELPGQTTKAHGVIVSARSPVIKSMLTTDMIEGRTKVIKMPNVDPEVFQHFLKFMYSAKLPTLTVKLALDLFEVADQYAVKGLAQSCSTYLLNNLTVENACDVLVVADAHSDAEFKDTVVLFMLEKKVPAAYSRWLEFCSSHTKLAVEVLNRFCKVVKGDETEEESEEESEEGAG